MKPDSPLHGKSAGTPKADNIDWTFRKAIFILLNFLGALLGYLTLYDSSGTVKPSWSEKLG